MPWFFIESFLVVPTLTGLFVSTTTGLVALNLQNLQAKTMTIETTYAVAVNSNLQKVYWSEGAGNCSIARSNFNGSDKEVIVAPTGNLECIGRFII